MGHQVAKPQRSDDYDVLRMSWIDPAQERLGIGKIIVFGGNESGTMFGARLPQEGKPRTQSMPAR